MMNRREQIIQIAKREFREFGYTSVSMRDIAGKMEVKAASLYNHIKSKQDILAAIIIEVAEEFTSEMQQIVQNEGSTRFKLDAMVAHHIAITIRNSDALAVMNNDWMHLDAQNLTYYKNMRDEYEANLRTIIKTGIANGDIKERNPEVILFSLLSSLRTLYLWYRKRQGIDEQTLKNDMAVVLLEGVI
ncbi:TetR/AcrR family transcriptional regulator [Psychroflexus aestuariivivens]|uniref:TetR/AcrR family transcriptional regulator n=1 Tax=Psychroflexus aestuariivivens TaxID=1795040 RepID=UPI0029394317|nr:TetR/AcrR family transcriptional regulator [Psychroflexus aestuariivivens]